MIFHAQSNQLVKKYWQAYMIILDSTTVFDNVDHDLLLLHLERQFGLHSVTLQ